MDKNRVNAYAEALYAVAAAEGATDAVEHEVFQFSQAVSNNPELRSTLTDARLPAAVRQQIVTDVLGEAVHPATNAVLTMLIGAGRAAELPAIVDALSNRTAVSSGSAVATVRSAVALTDDQKARLESALSAKAGAPVTLRNVVDPTVMGGIETQIGDEIIDGTIRSRVAQLRDAF